MNDEVHGIWRDAWKEFGSRKVSGKERRVTSDPWGRLTRDHTNSVTAPFIPSLGDISYSAALEVSTWET